MQAPNLVRKTFVYKQTGDIEIQSDVYLPTSTLPDHSYPVIVHFHGGGFIAGDRNLNVPDLFSEFIQANWIYISFDYRIGLEVKIYDLWSDCVDHWKWVFTELPKLLNIKFDLSKIGTIGESAGGYLALLSGYKLQPPPKVIVNYFGIVCIDSDFYNRPHINLPEENRISKEVMKLIETKPLTGAPVFTPEMKFSPRMELYTYLCQNGLVVKELWGLNLPEDLEKLSSWVPLKNISKDFPPTLVLHGKNDNVVPLSDSKELVQLLKKNGTDYQFVLAENEGHGWFYKKGDEGYENLVYPAFLWFKKYFSIGCDEIIRINSKF